MHIQPSFPHSFWIYRIITKCHQTTHRQDTQLRLECTTDLRCTKMCQNKPLGVKKIYTQTYTRDQYLQLRLLYAGLISQFYKLAMNYRDFSQEMTCTDDVQMSVWWTSDMTKCVERDLYMWKETYRGNAQMERAVLQEKTSEDETSYRAAKMYRMP